MMCKTHGCRNARAINALFGFFVLMMGCAIILSCSHFCTMTESYQRIQLDKIIEEELPSTGEFHRCTLNCYLHEREISSLLLECAINYVVCSGRFVHLSLSDIFIVFAQSNQVPSVIWKSVSRHKNGK